MQVDGEHSVVGGEALAVAELDALAEIEDPLGGTGLGFPVGGELGDGAHIGADFDQRIEEGVADGGGNGVVPGGRVKAFGGGAAADAELQHAALARGFRGIGVGTGDEGVEGGGTEAGGGGAAEQFAAVDAAGSVLLGQELDLLIVVRRAHVCVSLVVVAVE